MWKETVLILLVDVALIMGSYAAIGGFDMVRESDSACVATYLVKGCQSFVLTKSCRVSQLPYLSAPWQASQRQFASTLFFFLAHLSQRLMVSLLYTSRAVVCQCVSLSVHTLKH